jgi:hypothetical protein
LGLPVDVSERRLGRTPWIVARGRREEVFRALGERCGERIRAVIREIPDLPAMRGRMASHAARDQFIAIREASCRHFPVIWIELEALADGAQVSLENLILLNLRGDLGVPVDAGCSDLAWSDGRKAFIAHNEDDFPVVGPQCVVLTLLLDQEPVTTTWWCPGFLPGNTWSINQHGLIFTVDHLNIIETSALPARGFVARGLHSARSTDEAIAWLAAHPTAGGFAYTIGLFGDPRLVAVETGNGHMSTQNLSCDATVHWHTNHLRYMDLTLNAPKKESVARGDRLAGLEHDPDVGVDWLLSVLTSPSPRGVHRSATGGDDLATHISMVADLTNKTLTIATPSDARLTVPIGHLTPELASSSHAAVPNS